MATWMVLCLFIGVVPAMASGASGSGPVQVVDVLSDANALLMSDGSLRINRPLSPFKTELYSINLNLVEATGSNYNGLGLTADGKLAFWEFYTADPGIEPQFLPEAGEVRQIDGNYWLESDGVIRYLDGKKVVKVSHFKDIERFAARGKSIVAVNKLGQILIGSNTNSEYDKPSDRGTIPAGTSVAKLVVTGYEATLLLSDGRVILYDSKHVDYNARTFGALPVIPETLASDGVDISYDGETLNVVKKDGTLWNNAAEKYKLQLDGSIKDIKRSVLGRYYVQMTNGKWMAYNSKSESYIALEAPSVTSLAVKASKTSVNVGDIVKLTTELLYSTGDKIPASADQLTVSIDRPHLLSIQKDGSMKSTGVGEATISVTGYDKSQSVKIVSSLAKPIDGGDAVKGVNYVPLEAVFKAVGGTVDYEASSKTYTIKVGDANIKVVKGKTSAQVNDKKVTMKGAPYDNNGKTLVSADLLTSALGATSKWDNSKKQLTVSIGAGKLIVNIGKKPPATKMTAVAATGEMKGWKLLKGHPYEKIVAIYFKYDKNGILSVATKDIQKVDLNKKVIWYDDYGNKRVNTVKEIYKLYFSLSNKYTDDWLEEKFGDLYYEWLYPSTIDADGLVKEYLIKTGQMKEPSSYITLTPDAEFERE